MDSFVAGQEAERRQQFAEAQRLFAQVLPGDSNFPLALTRLGVLAAREGKRTEARGFFQRVLEIAPDSVTALEWMASFARTDGQLQYAIQLYAQARSLEPGNLRLWFGLADCLLERWDLDAALDGLQQLVRLSPEMPMVQDRLGVALYREGKNLEAEAAFREAIRLAPAMPQPYANLLKLLRRENRVEEMAALEAQIQAQAATSFSKRMEFVHAFLAAELPELTERLLKQAITEKPKDDSARYLHGRLLQIVGRYAEANQVLEELVRDNPGHVQAYIDLVRDRRMVEEDRPMLRHMVTLLAAPTMPLDFKRKLQFALGKAYDDLGEYKTALAHYEEANGLAALRLPSHLKDRKALVHADDRAIALFNQADVTALSGKGHPSEVPIFVLGMLRSGTTLAEQILSSHPMIAAGGEIPFLMEHAGEVVNPDLMSNREKLLPLAEAYLCRLTFDNPGAARVTDKMPANVLLLGLIHVMLPNARIILCERNPLDICLSNFVTPNDEPQAFSNSAEDLAFNYLEFKRLTDHYRQLVPANRLHVLNYEDIVTNTEPTLRALMDFLSLPWDDAVLAHHQNSRFITTPSVWQARQPLYSRSMERWRNYQPWIDELKLHLERGGWVPLNA